MKKKSLLSAAMCIILAVTLFSANSLFAYSTNDEKESNHNVVDITGMSSSLSYSEIYSKECTYEYSEYYKNAEKSLGVVNGFHITAFSKANLNAHTNGNILAKEAEFTTNAGTKGIGGEVAYIQKCDNITAYEPMNNQNSLLVVGYDNKVELVDNGNGFEINGAKLNQPKNLSRDSADIKYIDIVKAKQDVITLVKNVS